MAYDRSIRMWDEGHSPEWLDQAVKNGSLQKGKFLNQYHSYLLQMTMMRRLGVQSVLEIGPGEDIITQYMRSLDIQYDTMDIVSESSPTFLSRLEDFDPAQCKEKYELVCAFQMLEHSPYENFADNIGKMAVMSKRYVYISVPYHCRGLKFSLSISFGQRKRLNKAFSLYVPSGKPNRKYRAEYVKEFPWAVHYWEIGRKGFPLKRIIKDIESQNLRVIEQFHSENPYHYFLLAEKV